MARRSLSIATGLAGLLAATTGGRVPGVSLLPVAHAQEPDAPDDEAVDDEAADDEASSSEDAPEAPEDAASDETGQDEPAEPEDPAEGDEPAEADPAEGDEPSPDQAAAEPSAAAPAAERSEPAAAQAPAPGQRAAVDPGPVRQKVKGFLARFFSNHSLQDGEDIFALGFVNSLLALQIVAFVEKEFSIAVEDNDLDLDNFRSVNAIANLVVRKSAG